MTVWLSLGISLVAIAIAMILMRRMIDRRTGSAALLDEIRREVGAIITELNQTTERNIELIEDRIRSLQDTIGHADKRLSNLKREVERQEAATAVYSQLGRFRPPGPQPPPDESPPDGPAAAAKVDERPGPAASASSRADTSVSATVSNDETVRGEEPGPAGVTRSGEPAGRDEVVSVKDRVLSLYRQGVSVERIASRVGTAVSEVELIVSLSDR